MQERTHQQALDYLAAQNIGVCARGNSKNCRLCGYKTCSSPDFEDVAHMHNGLVLERGLQKSNRGWRGLGHLSEELDLTNKSGALLLYFARKGLLLRSIPESLYVEVFLP